MQNTDGALEVLVPCLLVHNYNSGGSKRENHNSHAGSGLEKLGYNKGKVMEACQSICQQ